jgi:hypothetical protein
MWPFKKKVEKYKELSQRTVLISWGYQRVKTYVCLEDIYRNFGEDQIQQLKEMFIENPEELAKTLGQYIYEATYEVKESGGEE